MREKKKRRKIDEIYILMMRIRRCDFELFE